MSRILLAEDDEAAAEALKFLLELHGFQVVVAQNGREALDRLEEEPPDILLTDIMMPILDGLELVRAVRRHPSCSALPVVLMSAAYTLIDHDLAVSASLRKPLDFGKLLSILKGLAHSAGES